MVTLANITKPRVQCGLVNQGGPACPVLVNIAGADVIYLGGDLSGVDYNELAELVYTRPACVVPLIAFDSFSGAVDQIEAAIRAIRSRRCVAYVANACGAAYVLAAACRAVIFGQRGGRVGDIEVKHNGEPWFDMSEAMSAWVFDFRPRLSQATVNRIMCGHQYGVEAAEATGLIDNVATQMRLETIAGHLAGG